MVDATHVKVHPDAAGVIGGNQAMASTKGGLNTKTHLAVGSHRAVQNMVDVTNRPTEKI